MQAPESPGRPRARWILATAIAAGAVVSQYVVPRSSPLVRLLYGGLVGDLVVVYGVPIVAFVLLVGVGPLRGWRHDLRRAAPVGLGWFGALSLLSLGVLIVLAVVYEIVDPSALSALGRPNPALRQAAANPWFYVGLSFLVGACEEAIFRGWIFGGWPNRAVRWIGPAVGSSAIFAGIHLYYGAAYGAASPFFYQQLFLLGFAFAATYEATGGNLLVPAVLHGVNDAVSFSSLVSPSVAVALHFGLIVGGAVVGGVYYALRLRPVAAPVAPPPPV